MSSTRDIFAEASTSEFDNFTSSDVISTVASGSSSCDIDLLRLVCEVYISIPICVFGVVGNVLEIIVLGADNKDRSTSVFLQSLAVLDSLLLAFAFLLQSLNTVANEYDVLPHYEAAYHTVFLVCYPCTYIVRTAGIYTTVSLTFDRYMAVSRPFSANRLCTKSRAWKQVSLYCSNPQFPFKSSMYRP